MRNQLFRAVQVTYTLVLVVVIGVISSNIYLDFKPLAINVLSKSGTSSLKHEDLRASLKHDDFNASRKHDDLRAESNNVTDFHKSGKCLINVHGLHHTGTGFLRLLIHESLKGLSSMHDAHVPEQEGQHIQNVYPRYADRVDNPSLCGLNRTSGKSIGRLYYCPKMVENAVKETDKTNLLDQWSKYWDLSKPYLIQKTPTLDILYLELKTSPTVHTILIKHPFRWYDKKSINRDFIPFVWLDVWTNTFELLASDKIKSFAVINYEMLINEESRAMQEISTMIKDECGFRSTIPKIPTIALNYHEEQDSSTFNKLTDYELTTWKKCEKNNECKNLMNDLKPIINEMGYSWDRDNYFLGSNVKKDGSLVLFSSNRRPSEDLVSKMKALARKYNI